MCISVKLDSFAIWLQLASAYKKCFRLSHQWTEIYTVSSKCVERTLQLILSIKADILHSICQLIKHVRICTKVKTFLADVGSFTLPDCVLLHTDSNFKNQYLVLRVRRDGERTDFFLFQVPSDILYLTEMF